MSMKDVFTRCGSLAGQEKQRELSLVHRAASFALVRFVLGAVLLTAAALKSELLFTTSTAPIVSWSLGLVLFELIIAAWLFSGILSSFAWWAAAGCFAFFAMVAGVKVLHGEMNCGCFGVVPTPPWVSLSIDLTALGCLAATYRGRASVPGRPALLHRFPAALGYALIVLVVAKAGVTLGYGGGSMCGDVTFGDPSEWVGRRFPLLESIDIDVDLSQGEYVVVLHRHGCSLCEETLNAPWFCDAVSARCERGRIALVELPPYGESANRGGPRFSLTGRLNASDPCLLPAPVVVVLQDALVLSVAAGEESPARLRELVGKSSPADIADASKLFGNRRESLALLEATE